MNGELGNILKEAIVVYFKT